MNPIVRLLLDALLREVEKNPQVLDQLIHEAITAFIDYLKAQQAQK